MPGERPEPRLRARGKIKAALKEFVHLIEKIQPEKAATRLQLDMARDAGLDACGKMLARIQRLERRLARTRGKRDAARNRLLTLLHELAAGPVIFPRPVGLPPIDPEQLERTFDELRLNDFPTLARVLQGATQQAEVLGYERYLVEEIFQKGSAILAEHLIRESRRPHPVEDEVEFLDALRHHIAGNVHQTLARQTGYQVTQEVAGQVDAVLVRTLRWLLDMLTISPPRRLILPAMGSDLDPAEHEVIPGRPAT
ncbi:MAG TPA: hypothetical protein VKD72_35145, partial [Gemmataceae bacterium]|nr:hypothetical protein [Gemmataceae bacterium]